MAVQLKKYFRIRSVVVLVVVVLLLIIAKFKIPIFGVIINETLMYTVLLLLVVISIVTLRTWRSRRK